MPQNLAPQPTGAAEEAEKRTVKYRPNFKRPSIKFWEEKDGTPLLLINDVKCGNYDLLSSNSWEGDMFAFELLQDAIACSNDPRFLEEASRFQEFYGKCEWVTTPRIPVH
jgi:hypothetical protein